MISVAESMSKKSRRKRDLREDLQRRAQQAVLGENSAQIVIFN